MKMKGFTIILTNAGASPLATVASGGVGVPPSGGPGASSFACALTNSFLGTREGNTDIGYPSSVLRDDGQIVAVHYEGNTRSGDYFMGSVVWDPVQTRKE
jgi:hypothetical protein